MKLDMNKYVKVRMAQANGVRTLNELLKSTDITVDTQEEGDEIETILKQACKCNNVSVESVVELVNTGVNTIEEIIEKTGVSTVCGRCKGVLANIIEIKR